MDRNHQATDPNFRQSLSDKTANRDSLEAVATEIAQHLRREANYLDQVIACNRNLTLFLKQPQPQPTLNADSPMSSTNQSDPRIDQYRQHETTLQHLQALRDDISQQAAELNAGRQRLEDILKQLDTDSLNPLSLRDLASRLGPPLQSELQQLRAEIKEKLLEIETMSLSNQAVLMYRLDFQQRMLTGITGDAITPHAYNAQGNFSPPSTGHLLQENC